MHTMHMVTAIIKPFKLDEVREALSDIGIKGMMVTDVRGFGHQMGYTELYRGAEFVVDFLPKLKIEVAVPGPMLDEVNARIGRTALTGRCGDGISYVLALKQASRIRTGEKGSAAL